MPEFLTARTQRHVRSSRAPWKRVSGTLVVMVMAVGGCRSVPPPEAAEALPIPVEADAVLLPPSVSVTEDASTPVVAEVGPDTQRGKAKESVAEAAVEQPTDAEAAVADDEAPPSDGKPSGFRRAMAWLFHRKQPVPDGETAEPQAPTNAVGALPEEPQAATKPLPPPPTPAAATNAITDYLIQPLDLLQIEVFGEPDISRSYPVSATGMIRHPLLDKVHVAGLTVSQVEENLTQLLSRDYLINPRVSVRVTQSTGRQVTLLGEVKKPGTYTIPHEQHLTLLQLVAIAGGFTDLAAINRVSILRDGTRSKVNVSDVLKGRPDTTDIELCPGDVVTVPETVW